MPNKQQVEAAARAIHAFELEHGYIAREWNGVHLEREYVAMAKAALTAAEQEVDSKESK